MLHIPQKGRWLTQHNLGTVGASSVGTSATTGAAAATKGTAVELIASTNFDACWVEIAFEGYGGNTQASRGMADILIGAATESVLIANLMFSHAGVFHNTDGIGPRKYSFPLFVPAGSRIAVQGAGERTATAFRTMIKLHGGLISPPFRVGGKVTTYGVGTVPAGTALTPGASGAEGAWAEMVASSSYDHFYLQPGFQIATDTGWAERDYFVDMGIGAATEEELVQSCIYWVNASEKMTGPWFNDMAFVDAPAASRLTMRASCSGTLESNYQGTIYGVS